MPAKKERRVRWTVDFRRIDGTPLFTEIMGLSPPQRGRRLLALAELGHIVSRGAGCVQVVPTTGSVPPVVPAVAESPPPCQYIAPDEFGDVLDEAMKRDAP